jgi:type II secretory pathway component PulM
MNDDSFHELERQLTVAGATGAPPHLRSAVLAGVARELRAARWDRRLARAAAMLLIVGVGLNAALVWQGGSAPEQRRQFAQQTASNSLVDTAIIVAEATDAETGRTFARQLAALRGRELTDQEIASIEAANLDRG